MGKKTTPEGFVNAIRDGEVEVDASQIDGGVYATVRRKLTLKDDIEGLTAEAFQHGAFDPKTASWGSARRRMEELIRLLR